MTSLDLLAPLLTDEIKELALDRVLNGKNLAPRGCDRRKVKLALIVVLEINPREVLSRAEAAVLYGVTENTFRAISKGIKNMVNLSA